MSSAFKVDDDDQVDDSSSANTSLSGFGDISHSEINFIPTLPSEISIQRSPSHRRNAKRPLPPRLQKSMAKRLGNLEDLPALLESLRDERRASVAELSKPPIEAHLEHPARIRLKDESLASVRKIPAPLQLSKKSSPNASSTPIPSSPVSPSKPFRGNSPLPQRPPLPRWDLLDPDVYLEGKQYKIRTSRRRA